MTMTEKTEELITRLREKAGPESIFEGTSAAELMNEAAEELEALAAAEAARLRDLEYPEYVPESVTDAAYDSQRLWWTPAENPEQRVIVPTLIESVAEAAYRATVKHLAEGVQS